jgi:riboflavin kinase/FMN adenylyltransferase
MSKKSVITIGTFDGVHRGHKLLINKTIFSAKKYGLKSVLITLEKPFKKNSLFLSSYEEKIEELKSFSIDKIVVINVPSKILSFSPNVFFDKFLLKELNVSRIICGTDFAFGKDKKGSLTWLKEKTKKCGVKLVIIQPLKFAGEQISSSNIRNLLIKGDVKNAKKMLGKNYCFSGLPFSEKKLGRKLGFPTVNLHLDKNKLIPKGVFISLISQNGRIYPSITNIGIRATFDRGDKIVPETHILNFNDVWKKKPTKITLLEKIRDEKKFTNVSLLKKQLSKDKNTALHFFDL